MLTLELKDYIRNNKSTLQASPTEFLREAGNFALNMFEIAELMKMLHNSDIDCDFTVVPKFFGYPDYNISFEDRETIISKFDDETRPLAKTLNIDGINDFKPQVLYDRIINDKTLSRCYIRHYDWSRAKEGPYLVNCGLFCDEQNDRIYTSVDITTADLQASIELRYPKICGKILDEVGYMYSKDQYERQVLGFTDQLQRVVEE